MTDTTGTLHVYLGYRDAPAAIDFLEAGLGFTTTMRVPDGDGGVAHSELRRGDATLVVFSDVDGYDVPVPRGDTVGQGVYLAVASEAEVGAAFARAVEAGATPVWEPASTDWNHRCRVRDPQGREWTFGTHAPG